MIVKEYYTESGKEFVKTYSDTGYYIQKVGTEEVYSEAIDPAESGREYTETDQPIEYFAEITAQEALDIIVGGEGV